MKIPKIYPITPTKNSEEELLNSIDFLKKNNLNFFQYRRKSLKESLVNSELDLLKQICTNKEISLIVNSWHGKELANKFNGIHLTSEDLRKEKTRSVSKENILGASCHTEEDISRAETLQVDYIFLSPINKTISHKKSNEIGWLKFSELCKKTKLPVYALGGLNIEDLSEAENNGAYGVAGISNFWFT